MIKPFTIYKEKNYNNVYKLFVNTSRIWSGFSFDSAKYPEAESFTWNKDYRDDSDGYWTKSLIESFNQKFSQRLVKTLFKSPNFFRIKK